MTTTAPAPTTAPAGVRPFRLRVPQADLDDLQERLARTRLPQPAPGDDWDLGVPTRWLADAVARWRTFDWRAVEARVGAFPQHLTEVDGQTVHFLHVPSPEPDATPLLLLHSYPGSFIDFLDVIGPLTDPVAHGGSARDAFSAVVPSMPGSAYSTPVLERGWTTARVARTWGRLMRRLGYERYGAHGSDTGAVVARELGLLAPEGFLGSHVLQAFSFPSGAEGELDHLQPRDFAALEHMAWFQSVDGTSLVPLDAVLAEVTLEWRTNTSAGVGRYHYEDARAGAQPRVNHSPMGVAVFSDDFKSIRSLAERDNDRIVHWSEHPAGGHYAALEVPGVLVEDVRAFFRLLLG